MNKKMQALRIMVSPLYRYRQALYFSFYLSRLYVDVVKRWRGFGAMYLLLLIAILSLPLSARMIFNFNHYINETLILPIKKIPSLMVQNGQVIFDKPMPYRIKNKNGDIIAIIDTTGEIKNIISLPYPKLVLLITKSKIYFRSPSFKMYSAATPIDSKQYERSLVNNNNEVFNGEDWIQASGVFKIKYITDGLVYPSLTLFIFSFYIVFLFMLALLGQVFAQVIFNLKLYFQESCRLMAVASTPMMVVGFVFMTLGWQFPGIGYIYVALLAFYFSYGVLAVRREIKRIVHH